MKTKFTFFTVILTMAILCTFGQTPNKHLKVNKNDFIKKILNNSSTDKDILLNDYTFSVSTGTYSNLTGSTPIVNTEVDPGEPWDDPESSIPIGFTFQLFDLNIDSVYLGAGLGGEISNFDYGNIILLFETDLEDRGNITEIPLSPITYKLEGATGNRIFKLEFKNAGFYEEDDSLETLNDYINFQLWLYEGTNKIEMHYGPNSIINPIIDYEGLQSAYIGLANSESNQYLLSGTPNNPTVNVPPFVPDSAYTINGTPANGIIYTFSKNITGINEQNDLSTRIYPNPVYNNLVINLNDNNTADVKILNCLGQKLIEDKIIGKQKIININSLNSGVYFIRIETADHKVITKKFIKQ